MLAFGFRLQFFKRILSVAFSSVFRTNDFERGSCGLIVSTCVPPASTPLTADSVLPSSTFPNESVSTTF